jgi:parallel beta-helix repeat protein
MNRIVVLLAIVLLTATPPASGQSRTVVNIRDYLSKNDSTDATAAVRAALDACRTQKAAKLVFPKGQYHFRPAKAVEKYLFISNNDEGLKRAVFDLSRFSGFEIEGLDASFIFHGYVCPFYIGNAQQIFLHGFSIDWQRPFHSEGKIQAVYKDSIDVSFSPEYPYLVKSERLLFTDADKQFYPFRTLLEFDAQKKETAFQALDYYTGPEVKVKTLPGEQVRLYVPRIKATPGNIFVFGANHRLCPGITISDSKEIRISDVHIYHSGGMAIIAQRSANIFLDSVQVTLPPGKDRILSATADATHFVNCSGRISMNHCLFENQEDDATNIHGIYNRITQRTGPATIEVQLVHPQQYGFDYIQPGSRLEFVQAQSLVTYHEATVQSVQRLNKEYTRVLFTRPLPDSIRIGDAVAATGPYPEVTIRNCIIRNNRARGILLGSRGKTLIENNLFHSPGTAILFEGDARFWYEQAGVRDVMIRRNVFQNCNYGIWGNALIQVRSGIEAQYQDSSRYNRNITIEENRMEIFDPRILNCYSISHFVYRNNTVVPSTAYPNLFAGSEKFIMQHSDHVDIRE